MFQDEIRASIDIAFWISAGRFHLISILSLQLLIKRAQSKKNIVKNTCCSSNFWSITLFKHVFIATSLNFLFTQQLGNTAWLYPDLPVPYIFGTKLPVANISGNDRPLVPKTYRELEDEAIIKFFQKDFSSIFFSETTTHVQFIIAPTKHFYRPPPPTTKKKQQQQLENINQVFIVDFFSTTKKKNAPFFDHGLFKPLTKIPTGGWPVDGISTMLTPLQLEDLRPNVSPKSQRFKSRCRLFNLLLVGWIPTHEWKTYAQVKVDHETPRFGV